MQMPFQPPTRLVCNAAARKRIVKEIYAMFGGACYECKCQLDINGTGLYAAPVIVHLPGERHPRRLACPGCAPAALRRAAKHADARGRSATPGPDAGGTRP